MRKYDVLKDKWSNVGYFNSPKMEELKLLDSPGWLSCSDLGLLNKPVSFFLNTWFYVIGIKGKHVFKLCVTDTRLCWKEVACFPEYKRSSLAAVLKGRIYIFLAVLRMVRKFLNLVSVVIQNLISGVK